jgi:hypothetical protein
LLYEGYWRRSLTSTHILKCPFDGACLGSSLVGNESCSVGYSGKLCSSCEVGYYQSSKQCNVLLVIREGCRGVN